LLSSAIHLALEHHDDLHSFRHRTMTSLRIEIDDDRARGTTPQQRRASPS